MITGFFSGPSNNEAENRRYRRTRRGDDLSSFKVGEKVHISFCDTSASVVYSCDGHVAIDDDGDLCVINGIRADKFKHIDGCYTFVEKKS